ncbi:MAG: porphobilinogen synthase [bacterium]|nr:porphobilinogen synthase [bacterium]
MFPLRRLRRYRKTQNIRKIFEETYLQPHKLVQPIFVVEGKAKKIPIRSMEGIFQLSIDNAINEIKECYKRGILAFILFGIPNKKDEIGSGAWAKDGIIQKAVRAIKDALPDVILITDLCFCEYTTHGHCGVVKKIGRNFELLNDETLENIKKTAVSQAEAGSDIIAPSGMIDGMVKVIRMALDDAGYTDRLILSYSAKFASQFYGPFREAALSAPKFGDRKSYQLNPANFKEAVIEMEEDILEGADMIMVKPALAYLDLIYYARSNFKIPIVAYNVSGEYSMIKYAAKNKFFEEDKAFLEILLSIKRAGADLIITYKAKDISKLL